MLGLSGRLGPRDPSTIAAVKTWARRALGLPPDSALLVTELACHEPGCPPVETVIADVSRPGVRRTWKLHQPLSTLTEADIHRMLTADNPTQSDATSGT
jgi:hypothetical protein